MKVSVIIPVYNVQQYLDACIESVVNQIYANLEIIIINDGSTDESLKVANAWKEKDSRILVIDKPNTGVSDSRNHGIDMATGDCVLFLDGDDTLQPDCVKFLSYRMSITKADIAKCGFRYFSDDNNKSRIRHVPTKNTTGQLAYIEFLKGKGWLSSACGSLYNIRLLRENSIRFECSEKIGEDGIFTMNAINNAKTIDSTDVPLVNIRVRLHSASRSKEVYSVEHKYVDNIESLIDNKPFRNAFKIRVLTSNLYRTAFISDYLHFSKIYDTAVCDSYNKVNVFEYRKHLPPKLQFLATIAKSKRTFFYFIKILLKLGYTPML